MKKILYIAICAIFISSNVYAAGTMSNVNQSINLENARITSQAGGASGGLSAGPVKISGEANYGGVINMGEIENSGGGTMRDVTQDITAKNAKIQSNGADINIGRIKNK